MVSCNFLNLLRETKFFLGGEKEEKFVVKIYTNNSQSFKNAVFKSKWPTPLNPVLRMKVLQDFLMKNQMVPGNHVSCLAYSIKEVV